LQTIVDQTKTGDTGPSPNEPPLDLANLFQTYYPRIYNYLRYRVTMIEDAEDLIGTVFEQAYKRRAQYDPAKGAFSTWLFRIAHNALIDFYRSRERRTAWVDEGELPLDLVTPEASPEGQVMQQEMITRLLQGLNQLSERDQEVISLKFAGRLRNTEIGEVLDMKEKTVSVVLLRAMRRLRQQLEPEAAQ
jgi:RNA polymerase sigma-70 factor (ECF subfamily)